LTELYAVGLEGHAGFASKVFALAGLPPADTYKAYTQERLADGSGRLDLRLLGMDAAGRCSSVLYAEHKQPGGGWGEDQPGKYLAALNDEIRRSGAEGRFLIVVGSNDSADDRIPHRGPGTVRKDVAEASTEAEQLTHRGGHLVVAKTWQDIANCAEIAGREGHDTDDPLGWREAVARPGARASQRILRELLWYFEERGYAVTDGLTAEQVKSAPRAMEIEDRLEALIDATTPHLTEVKLGRHALHAPRGGGRKPRTQDFKIPTRSWVERWKGGIWFGYDTDARPGRGVADGTLEFQVGVWLRKRQARLLDNSSAFKDQIAAHKLNFDVDDDGGWIWAAAPAITFITEDVHDTIDTQAERIAGWALPNLTALLSLKPGRYNG
jgi:hypothetical protein